jgi:hypothetical protein
MIGFGEFVALGVVGVGGGVAFERRGIGVVGAIADDGFGEYPVVVVVGTIGNLAFCIDFTEYVAAIAVDCQQMLE